MGCDGGTIPKRDELVKVKKRPEQKDKVSELRFRWNYCASSQEPLKKPIVACGLGRLYNKDTIIQNLLEKSSTETTAHIKSLKDIKDLNLTHNPVFKDEAEKGDNQVDRHTAPYICPISGLEMNGKFKFCFFWTCGCVMSERGIKQFTEKVCANCQTPFDDNDVITLNATGDDLTLMNDRLNERRAMMKSIKKQKKIQESCEDKTTVQNVKSKNQTPSTHSKPSTSISTNGKWEMTKSTTSKRTLEEMVDPAFKKTKTSYSVAKDPGTTEVFKSLFTTHKDAQSRTKAHWITYNPCFN